MAAPLEVMQKLYTFLTIPVTAAMLEQVYLHFHAEGTDGRNSAMSTFRTSDFNRSLTLPTDVKHKLHLHCKGLMELGKYS